MAKRKDGTYDNDQKWMEAQEKWLETQDEKYLWDMYPYYLHSIKSCMVKRLKGQWIPGFNEKAEEAALYQLEYHKRHPEKKIDRLMSWSSFLCMYALYGSKSKKMDQYEEELPIEEVDFKEEEVEDDIVNKILLKDLLAKEGLTLEDLKGMSNNQIEILGERLKQYIGEEDK